MIRTNAQRAELDRLQMQAIARACQDSAGSDVPMRITASAGGDPLRLRGIPAIGRNVSGCIIGSDPERESTR